MKSHEISWKRCISWTSFHVHFIDGEMSIWWVLMKEFVNRVSSFFGGTHEQERRGKCVLRPTNTLDWGHTGSVEAVSFSCSRNCHCTTFSSSSLGSRRNEKFLRRYRHQWKCLILYVPMVLAHTYTQHPPHTHAHHDHIHSGTLVSWASDQAYSFLLRDH